MKICILNMDKSYTDALTRKFCEGRFGFVIEAPEMKSAAEFDFSFLNRELYDVAVTDSASLKQLVEFYERTETRVSGQSQNDTEKSGKPTFVVLTKDNDSVGVEIRNDPDVGVVCIDRYAPVSEIAKAIRMAYTEAKRDHPANGDAYAALSCNGASPWSVEGVCTETIGVVGSAGGAGTSSVALGIAGELSRFKDKRTLYLSFESVESDRLCRSGLEGCTYRMSDLVYRFLKEKKQGNQKVANRENNSDTGLQTIVSYIETIVTKDSRGALRIPPDHGRNTICELDGEDAAYFIQCLIIALEPEYLILDLGNGYAPELMKLAACASQLVFVTAENSVKNFDALHLIFNDRKETCITVRNKTRIPDYEPAPEFVSEQDSYADKLDRLFGNDDEDPDPASAKQGIRSHIQGIKQSLGHNHISERENTETRQAYDISIGYDPSDFEQNGKNVDVSLSNAFGIGIKELVDKLLGWETPDDERYNNE